MLSAEGLSRLVVTAISLLSILAGTPGLHDGPGSDWTASAATEGPLGLPYTPAGDFPLKLSFVENAGQHPSHLRFALLSDRLTVGFADGSLDLVLRRPVDQSHGSPHLSPLSPGEGEEARIRLAFEGARSVVPEGRRVLPHRTNFYFGNDPLEWRAGVRSFEEVVYPELYAGIDLRFHVEDTLKYEYLLDAGVDPGTIRLRYEGVERLTIVRTGDLVVETAAGALRDTAPVAYQGSDLVDCTFVLLDGSSVGFDCRGWDPARPLVVDPLIYSTFVGGAGSDWGHAIAVDASDRAYVAGTSSSNDFPVTGRGYSGNGDPFVAVFDPTGSTLIYATFLGGWTADDGYGLAVDGGGNAYITGMTTAPDFPVTPGAFDTTPSGTWDGFVAKLSPAGTLVYSTYLGGNATRMDIGYGIAVDAAGRATVTGFAESPDFPTTPGAFDTTWNGDWDAFVARLDPTGSALEFSTFLGSTYTDIGLSVALDAAGDVHLAGYTVSPDFPNTAASFDPIHNGGVDVFVAELSGTGDRLLSGGFLGGSGFEGNLWFYIIPVSLVVDGPGNAYIAGHTGSADFPVTSGAFDTSCGSDGLCDRYYSDVYTDGFVAKIDASGGALVYATFLGGNLSDWAVGIATGPAGEVFVTGATASADFPITAGASNGTIAGQSDVFVASLDASGSSVLHATFLGSIGWDWGDSIARDAVGDVYVTGYAHTGDFPTTPGAFDRTHSGSDKDTFVAKLSMGGPSLHSIVVDSSPSGLQLVVDGTAETAPHTLLCTDGTPILVEAPSPQGGATARHVFRSWSDGGAQAHSITCDASAAYVAAFDRQLQIVFDTKPANLELLVDGATQTSRTAYWWQVESTHTVAVVSPQIMPTAVYRYASWNDGGARNRTLTADLPATFVAQFEAVYLLVLTSEHGPVSCDLADCWYPSGATARVNVGSADDGLPGTRYAFERWSGDAHGTSATVEVVMDGPRAVIALWTTEHLLTVESSYGVVSGAGWHLEGTNADVSISPPEDFVDGRRFRFTGWTGDAFGAGPNITVVMDRPKNLTAHWQEVEPTDSVLIVAVAVVITAAAMLSIPLVMRRRRRRT